MSPVKAAKGDKKKCDDLARAIVRARGRCERCGQTDPSKLVWAHIVRRTPAHTRTDTRNAWCLCSSCHYTVDNDPWEFMQLVDKTIGQVMYQALRRKANDGVRVKFDWSAELVRLRAMRQAQLEPRASIDEIEALVDGLGE